jgi:hypothetical protein
VWPTAEARRVSYERLGLFSRQDAKNAKFGFIFFLCGLCAFARDILAFGYGSAPLGCGEYFFTGNPE